jgi:hypothetical protein
MSTNLDYKQVANVERRTWDVETYEKRAKERAKNDEDGEKTKSKNHKAPLNTLGTQDDGADEGQKEEFQRATKGAAGPAKSERAFLQARRKRVDVDSKIGSVEIVNPDAAATTKAYVGEPGSIKVRTIYEALMVLVNLLFRWGVLAHTVSIFKSCCCRRME